ncbi:MAG: alpha/beta hydrolase [Bacteroidetes bacterium]|nr:alpha/beta hydrolase [Bacteroidota bacterium]
MIIQELKSQGNTIIANIYPTQSQPEYAVIMNSATGAKQSYFRYFAAYLAEKGILVITYDYSGIGQSAPESLVGYQTDLVQWGEDDMDAVVNFVVENYTYKKLVFVNQSVGGQIAPLCPSIHRIDGMVNVACSLPYWKLWPFPQRFVVLFNSLVMFPITALFGYFPGKKMGIMENLPKEVGRQWMRWVQQPHYLFDSVEGATEKFASLTFPLISYSFDDDTTSPKNTIEALNVYYRNCELTYKHIYPDDIGVKSLGHFGFFREKCRVLWDDLIEEMRMKI